MFTGLIEKVVSIESITYNSKGAILNFIKPFDCNIGDSIAINGVCLTISQMQNNLISFDIMNDTLKNTILSNLKKGDKINIERAMKINDRFDGHLVSGHVDCIGIVKTIRQDGFSKQISFQCENKYIIEKGSIAVNGVSLTVQNITNDGFSISLIPTTQEKTNLYAIKLDEKVNIEYDLIGKYVYKYTNPKETKITLNFLKENGF